MPKFFNKNITDHHKKITGMPTANSSKNLNRVTKFFWLKTTTTNYLTLLSPCWHHHAHGHVPTSDSLRLFTWSHHYIKKMALTVMGSSNGRRQQTMATGKSEGNLNHLIKKNWHKTTTKKLPHCPGLTRPSPCSMPMPPPSHLKNSHSPQCAMATGNHWVQKWF